ncbi:MAG: hypothetical protein DHS20C10_11770 [marine bacterium B5-7]|nr:MAG: hypothetical protein DHS20C10_11770 [marine bacterium B5-7]
MRNLTVLLMVGSLAASTAVVTGCSDMNKQDMGTMAGGTLGALIGSRFGGGTGQMLAMGVGAVAGAVIGGQIGKTMDENDKLKMQQTLEKTPTDKTNRWRNPDNGNVYSVTPTRTYKKDGHPCRAYSTKAFIDGKQETINGTACRDDEGKWQAVS